jgi:hypothetical protein
VTERATRFTDIGSMIMSGWSAITLLHSSAKLSRSAIKLRVFVDDAFFLIDPAFDLDDQAFSPDDDRRAVSDRALSAHRSSSRG